MYYSITFESLATGEKKNTWEDWHLIPSAPPKVNNPEVYTNYVDIPGRKDGPLDLSEVLSDGPVFLQTEGSWEFIWSEDYCPFMTFDQAYKAVTKFLHGYRFRITMEEDLDTSYIGRIQVTDPKPGNAYSTITINYTINPTDSNPIDVNESDYTSSTGELPWYSGGVSGGSSSGGSGSGSGSGGTNSSLYNSGWNDAVDAFSSFTGYLGDNPHSAYIHDESTNTDVLTSVLTGNVRAYNIYSTPSRKTGALTDYGRGWNAAIDASSNRQNYYLGTYYGSSNNDLGMPYLKVSGTRTGGTRPSKK